MYFNTYYSLRSSTGNAFKLPRLRSKFRAWSFSYCGPAAWNALPANNRILESNFIVFKRLIHLFTGTYNVFWLCNAPCYSIQWVPLKRRIYIIFTFEIDAQRWNETDLRHSNNSLWRHVLPLIITPLTVLNNPKSILHQAPRSTPVTAHDVHVLSIARSEVKLFIVELCSVIAWTTAPTRYSTILRNIAWVNTHNATEIPSYVVEIYVIYNHM
jgi:hypothetical protein